MAQSCQYFTHKEQKNLIRESFSLALSYFLSTTETRVQSEEVYLTLIRYPTITSQYKLHYQPRSQGSLLPVPTERETGRVEENPGNEVTPFPIFSPKHPVSLLFFTSVSYRSTPLISPFCLGTSLLTCQYLNIPYHINFPQISRIPLIFHVSIPGNPL